MTRVTRFCLTLLLAVALLVPAVHAVGSAKRLRPLPEDEWSPEVQKMLGATRARVAVLEGAASGGTPGSKPETRPSEKPKTLNILRTIAHHPKLLGSFLGFATVLAQEGALSRRDSELLALRASWNCQSDFEWGHHVEYARAAGLTDPEIARIARGPSAPGWSSEDRLLLRAADQLHAGQQVEDDVWQGLVARYSEAQLVEIPFVVGQYTMLSMVANSTGVELEDGYDRLPITRGRIGEQD